MALKPSQLIWHDGKLIPWEQATVHVLTHALHYGSSVFEGVRVYKTPEGAVAFRLSDHIRRMYDSAKIYRLEIPYALETLVADPALTHNTHTIRVAGNSGRFTVALENVSSPDNPKTAWLACFSALAALRALSANARYGT